MPLSDGEFRLESDNALERLNRLLDVVPEKYGGEVFYQNGVLTIEIEEPDPGKIVISPNAPVRQIWISAHHTSFKLDWSDAERTFVYRATGESLQNLVGRLAGEQLGVGTIAL